MIRRKFLVVGILVMVSLAFLYTVVYASSYTGTLSITCAGFGDLAPDTIHFDRDNTGTGNEVYQYVATDGAGTVLFTFSNQLPLGNYTLGSADYTTAPAFNPITVTLTSLAGNDLSEQQIFSIQGNCSGLPTFGAASACLPLTADAVVGDMPFQTQAYWAPGKQSPGLMIDPGTYWVLGEDSSGSYYEILLACQYLWVPVDAMQPSFQPPWNGQPLPTDNVE